MNQKEYLQTLDRELGSKIPDEERREILTDYEEHFAIGLQSGRTEEAISSALGDPAAIAREFRANYHVRQAETHASAKHIYRATVATIGLGIFNLVIVLIPAVILSIIVAMVAALGAAFVFFGPFFLVISVLAIFGLHPGPETMSPLAGIFIGIGLTALGPLVLIGIWYFIRAVYRLAVRYLKWNIAILTGKERIP